MSISICYFLPDNSNIASGTSTRILKFCLARWIFTRGEINGRNCIGAGFWFVEVRVYHEVDEFTFCLSSKERTCHLGNGVLLQLSWFGESVVDALPTTGSAGIVTRSDSETNIGRFNRIRSYEEAIADLTAVCVILELLDIIRPVPNGQTAPGVTLAIVFEETFASRWDTAVIRAGITVVTGRSNGVRMGT